MRTSRRIPKVDWPAVSRAFVESLGLGYNLYTTQIEPHDYMAEYFHALSRFNQVLLDLDRDIWGYISINYFKQRARGRRNRARRRCRTKSIRSTSRIPRATSVSANAVMLHLAEKLPVSRWQRDLSDSTALRNLGVALGYCSSRTTRR